MSHWVEPGTQENEVEYIGTNRVPAYSEQFTRHFGACQRTGCSGALNGLLIQLDGEALCWSHVPESVQAHIVSKYGHQYLAHPDAGQFNAARAKGLFGPELTVSLESESPALREGRANEVVPDGWSVIGAGAFNGGRVETALREGF